MNANDVAAELMTRDTAETDGQLYVVQEILEALDGVT